jgi:hypothetical protein
MAVFRGAIITAAATAAIPGIILVKDLHQVQALPMAAHLLPGAEPAPPILPVFHVQRHREAQVSRDIHAVTHHAVRVAQKFQGVVHPAVQVAQDFHAAVHRAVQEALVLQGAAHHQAAALVFQEEVHRAAVVVQVL